MEFQNNNDNRPPTWEEIKSPELEEHKPDAPETWEGPLPPGIMPGSISKIFEKGPQIPDPEDYKWRIPPQKD